MKPNRVLFVLTGVVLTWGLAGCGGGGEPVPDGSAASGELGSGAPPATRATSAGACDLVTQVDVGALFGQPASRDTGPSGAAMFDQCLWTWDTDTSNQLLQFSIWDPLAYAAPEDSEPLELGDGGYVRAHPMAGVDINWIQGGRMISLSYSTVGPDAPKATAKVEDLKALARQVSSRL